MYRQILRIALGLGSAAALAAGGALGSAVTAAADYGPGAQYQVEISSNPPGFGIWIWAELGPGQTSDYQETDCIHLGGGHDNDAAAHDSGELSGWSVSNGTLTMNDMHLIANNVIANISVPVGSNGYGKVHSMTMTVTWEAFPAFPVGVPIQLPATGVVAP